MATSQVHSDKVRPPGMSLVEALKVLAELRRDDQVVLTQMGSSREWPKLSDHVLDLNYLPSTMGGGPPLGLGLAMAQPKREVLVLSGDGCLLMSLGCLVSIVDSGATNLSVIVLDNGIYEVTGGQHTAAAAARADFAGFARAAGFPNVAQCSELSDWQQRAADIFQRPGPRFVWLTVQPVGDDYALRPLGPMAERVERFCAALSTR